MAIPEANRAYPKFLALLERLNACPELSEAESSNEQEDWVLSRVLFSAAFLDKERPVPFSISNPMYPDDELRGNSGVSLAP